MTFVQMFQEICTIFGNKQIAEKLCISEQYVCDLRKGRRLPSVNVVNSICTFMGRGPMGVAEWHHAGASAHGWKVWPPNESTGEPHG